MIELGGYIAWHGGERIVNRRTDDPGSAYLKVSPTGAMLARSARGTDRRLSS